MAKPNRDTELRPTADSEFEAARPEEGAGQADAEGALDRLERFLASWSPKNPPPKIPAPLRTVRDADRSIFGAGDEAAAPPKATAKARPRRRVLKGALLVLAVASVAGAAFALNGAPALNKLASISFDRAPDFLKQLPPISFDRASDLFKELPSIVVDHAQGLLKQLAGGGPAAHQTAPPPAGEGTLSGSGAASPPLLREKSEPDSLEAAHSDETPARPESEVPDPRAGTLRSAPQTSSPSPSRPAEPPSENALIATPVSPAATGASAAAEAVRSDAEPEPKGADALSGGTRPSGSRPPAPQSDKRFIAGEGSEPKSAALEAAPLPPVRPATLGRRVKQENTSKPRKSAEEPQAEARAPLPERTEAPAERSPANPLLRALTNAFK